MDVGLVGFGNLRPDGRGKWISPVPGRVGKGRLAGGGGSKGWLIPYFWGSGAPLISPPTSNFIGGPESEKNIGGPR